MGIGEILKGIFFGKNSPITAIADVADRFIRTKEDRDKFHKEMEIISQDAQNRINQLVVEDRVNAREREIQIAKTGRSDIMKIVTGIAGLVMALIVILSAFFWNIENENIFYFIAGVVFAITKDLFAYYFGSSQGSTTKQETINKYLDKEK